MTNNNNVSADKEVRYSNIKQLNTIVSQGNAVSVLQSNIKNLKSKIDTLLSKERAKEQDYLERLRTENEQTVVSDMPAVDSVPPVESKEREVVSVIKEPLISDTPRQEKTAPVVEKKERPAAAPPHTETVRTRQFDVNAKPSYVKGIITPEVPPPYKKPQYNKPGQGQNPNRNYTPGSRPGGYQGRQGGDRPQGGGFQRTQGGAGGQFRRPDTGAAGAAKTGLKAPAKKIEIPASKERKSFDKKKEFTKQHDDKKSMTKRTLIRKGFIQENLDEERMGSRKLKNKKQRDMIMPAPVKIEKAVITTENLTVKILSEKIGKTAQEIIKQLMVLGIMTSINSVVDFPTMELVANELGVELELKLQQSKESQLEEFHDASEDDDKNLVKRPPIITVMGHVDHGKTSLLDTIRKTTVAEGEAGGITQHIGAYSVVAKGEKITFLDTPGHEAFTEMRARGAKVTDIAILIVAADDGVMPQTVEAINHAKAAEVPILVAINKIDKPGANIEKIKQELTEYGLVTEEWGGDTIMVPISAKRGDGIDKLLEMVLFLAEYNNYRANPDRKAMGSVIEAKLDKGKGPVANIIVMNGTLRVGDFVVSGMSIGRVRAMVDDKGRSIKEAGPSTPVSILGLTDVPNAGDAIYVVEDEKVAKQVMEERENKRKKGQQEQGPKVTLEDVFNKVSEGQIKGLNIVIKADVQGSVEALKTSLLKLSDDEVRINVIHEGVGAINKSDLMRAEASKTKTIIVGFNVRPDSESKIIAENTGLDIRLYKIIYEAIEDIERVMKSMVTPKYRDVTIGRAQVRNVIKLSSVGIIAGSYVLSGKIQRNAKVHIFRDGNIIFEGKIDNLKRFKEDVREVATGYECGISVVGFSDFKENDEIEAFISEEIK